MEGMEKEVAARVSEHAMRATPDMIRHLVISTFSFLQGGNVNRLPCTVLETVQKYNDSTKCIENSSEMEPKFHFLLFKYRTLGLQHMKP